MLINCYRTIIKKLNEIRFWGLKDYALGSVLTVPVSDILSSYSINTKFIIKRLILAMFFRQFEYNKVISPESKILFLFSQSYVGGGNYHKKLFNNVANLLLHKDTIVAKKIRRVFDLSGLILLIYLPIWLFQMWKINEINFMDKIFLLSFLLESKKWILNQNFKVFSQKYKLLVTFCDVHLADNIMAQRFKKAGITTATLQHGWYRETLHDADTFSNIELGFEGFISDKFLAWGEYIKSSAIRSGINPKSVICLGHPKFIGFQGIIKKKTKNKFGLILGRSVLHCQRENRELISIANQVSQKYGFKYIVKYHPSDSDDELREYDSLINPEYMFLRSDKDLSVDRFGEDVEFSIIGSSSVFADLLYMGEIIFRYTRVNDDYDKLDWGKFINQTELFNLIDTFFQNKDDFRGKAREIGWLLCGKGNIVDNYRNFFGSYL
jgi:hypothetical protein